ncbi:MAG TPA: LamG-like jellyroll fold domain-containing protein, partial [Verrucomicrobiae bacterium]
MNQTNQTRVSSSRGRLRSPACIAGLVLVAASAQAQFTYPGNADLNAAQIYDGLGVDSAMNPHTMGTISDGDYIGTGSGHSGSLTVLSGSLTITNNDFKVGVSSGAGALYLGQNAIFNVESVGNWGAGVGQNGGSVGTVVVSNNATLNFNVGGSAEQRLTWGINGGTVAVTILGGAINVTNGVGATDDQRSFNIGAQNGHGTVNLLAGTITDSMPLPFGLGGQYQTMNSAPTWADSSTSSSLIISNGSFVMTGICPATDASKATFNIGTNSYVVFYNGAGSLSLNNWSVSDYQTLVDNGRIRIGLPGQTPIVANITNFTYSSVGGQGVLQVIPFTLPPTIAGQPQSQHVVTGTTIQMSATGISGNTPFVYQWQLSGTNLANSATFSGVNSNILTIANAALGNSGPYQLIVTNLYGSTTSSVATLTVQSPALVGAWLNDGTTNLADVSGYALAANHTAMLLGVGNYMFTNDVPAGKTGQSLFLFNADTYLAISNSSSAVDASYDNTFDDAMNNQFSVMFWAKGLPIGAMPFVSKAGESAIGWQLRYDYTSDLTNYPMFTVRDNNAGTNTLGTGLDDLATRSFPTDDGQWHNYAGTYDAITGVRKLYVDGVLAASEVGNVKYNLAAGAHLCIGAKENASGTPSGYATVEIFRVQIYNYALAPSQITTEVG